MCVRLHVFVSPKAIYFVVLKIDTLLWSLFRFHGAAIMREAHFLFLGCAVSHLLALPYHLSHTYGVPGKTKCFCGVEIVILAKFCLLIDLGPKTPDYWGCRNPSA